MLKEKKYKWYKERRPKTLALLKGRLAQLQEDVLANPEEKALVQLGDQALSATRRSNPGTTRRENSSRLVRIYSKFFRFSITFLCMQEKMTISTKLDEKLEGVDNLRACKYGVMLTLEENQSKRVH